MMKTKLHRRTTRGRKKNITPLSKLRPAEVVRTIVAHPRRLEELVNLLQDKERSMRVRAAATLARLSESHPARLVRHLERLRGAVEDDSAYVRWHAVYALGRLISSLPRRSSTLLPEVKGRIKDENRMVRIFAVRALESVAIHKPQLVKALYSSDMAEIPVSVARLLKVPTAPGNG
jgi:hypothetical protein